VSDGSRVWAYSYDAQGDLSRVQLPDGSAWQFSLGGLIFPYTNQLGEAGICDWAGFWPGDSLSGQITHPSGAVGTFTTRYIGHGRHDVLRLCVDKSSPLVMFDEGAGLSSGYARWPHTTVSQTLVSKTIAGPGLPAPLAWQFQYTWQEGMQRPPPGDGDRANRHAKTLPLRRPLWGG
jgi:YD repeat-containing protein